MDVVLAEGAGQTLLSVVLTAFFPTGKLIICNVTGIAHRRPQGESYDQAIRNDETGLWQCPFCQQDNFPELSEVCAVWYCSELP